MQNPRPWEISWASGSVFSNTSFLSAVYGYNVQCSVHQVGGLVGERQQEQDQEEQEKDQEQEGKPETSLFSGRQNTLH